MRALLLAILAPMLASTTPPAVQRCSMPVPVPRAVTTPQATFYNDGEPPARFAHVPKVAVSVRWGQDAINEMCGRPPCGMIFEGCTSGNDIALPDPFKVDSATLARIIRHELGHHAGWPATHGA